MPQHRTHIDFETRSLVDLRAAGEHSYAQHDSTSPLMLAYATDQASVDLTDFFADLSYPEMRIPQCPVQILSAIHRDDIFVAHNARFEQAIWYWICHLRWKWPMIQRWSCTAARSRYWGVRASLEGAGSDLELLQQKNADGKLFIPTFCKPRQYKGRVSDGIVKTPWADPRSYVPEEWRIRDHVKEIIVPARLYALGIQYCKDDVATERELDATLPDLPPFEQDIWELDHRMNTRGLPIDVQSVHRAGMFADYYTMKANKRFEEVTGLYPTQRDRVLEYINQREEIMARGELRDLKGKTLKRIVLDDLPQDLRDIIGIRLETSKASIKKLEAMERGVNSDQRARGLFLYRGAHTGRWTGKRIQPQNYKRPDMDILKAMFEYLNGPWWNAGMVGHNGGPPLDEMSNIPAWIFEAGMRFPRPLGALAKSMKGFIAAPPGTKFITGDYAQIEARVLAWLARCMWLLNAFRDHDDVYMRFAALYMYGLKYEDCIEIVKGKIKTLPPFADKRQKGKHAVLGCGYNASGRAFQEYCDNVDVIISLEEAKTIVQAYRRAHPEIADYTNGLWARVERAWIIAATSPTCEVVELGGTGVTFHLHRLDTERYWLICTVPGGNHIAYYRPKVTLGEKWGRPAEIPSYRREWNGKTYREDTYGGKIVQNICELIARNICAIGALNVDKAGYPVIGLVHDEVISNPEESFGSALDFQQRLCMLPAEIITDLPVEAEAAEMRRYGK